MTIACGGTATPASVRPRTGPLSVSAVTVTVAGRQIARFCPASDFTQEIVLPAEALASAEGKVVITSDKWFVPADRRRTPDRRHLALRIYSYSVR